jgi:hypothetical protein
MHIARKRERAVIRRTRCCREHAESAREGARRSQVAAKRPAKACAKGVCGCRERSKSVQEGARRSQVAAKRTARACAKGVCGCRERSESVQERAPVGAQQAAQALHLRLELLPVQRPAPLGLRSAQTAATCPVKPLPLPLLATFRAAFSLLLPDQATRSCWNPPGHREEEGSCSQGMRH